LCECDKKHSDKDPKRTNVNKETKQSSSHKHPKGKNANKNKKMKDVNKNAMKKNQKINSTTTTTIKCLIIRATFSSPPNPSIKLMDNLLLLLSVWILKSLDSESY